MQCCYHPGLVVDTPKTVQDFDWDRSTTILYTNSGSLYWKKRLINWCLTTTQSNQKEESICFLTDLTNICFHSDFLFFFFLWHFKYQALFSYKRIRRGLTQTSAWLLPLWTISWHLWWPSLVNVWERSITALLIKIVS